MTGYGRSTTPLGARTLTVQVSSVNRKSLDLTMKLPEAWEALESAIGERVRKFASRGKVHVDLEVTGSLPQSESIWDSEAVAGILERLATLAKSQSIEFKPTSELIWNIANSQRRQDELPPVDVAQPQIIAALDVALCAFASMRAEEGATLLVDFIDRLKALRTHLEAVATRAPGVVVHHRDQLLQRLRQAGLELDLNDERVLKEIALFADRCDLSEEITRFRSHSEQFETLLKSDGEIGRKAEFILQEMGREVHTMGSKANDLTISRAVIELKNELERVREQIANVE